MTLPDAIRASALHALSWLCLGLLILAGLMLAYHYLTNRRRFQ